MTPKRKANLFTIVTLIHCPRKVVGDPFAEGSRRLSHNFAIVTLIHCRLMPTRPFNK
ncbi:MAG: hypothetical protein LBK82_10265 [Planctomycetaceae bacterium]|nr:hypothetical protein [Planctomycetaceae bacterium]